MLIVLDNWRFVGIPSNTVFLRMACYGALGVSTPILDKSRDAGMNKISWHHFGGQFFTPREKQYISAVAYILPHNPYCDLRRRQQMYVRVVHNVWAAVPLPTHLFDGSKDEHFGYVREGEALKWVRLPTDQSLALGRNECLS